MQNIGLILLVFAFVLACVAIKIPAAGRGRCCPQPLRSGSPAS